MLLPHRIPIPLRPDRGHGLTRRQSTPPNSPGNRGVVPVAVYIVIGVLISILCVLGMVGFLRRKQRNANSKKGKYEQASTSIETPANFDAAVSRTQLNNGGNVSNGSAQVARQASIRSILTLPVYRHNADDNEKVLGREGERDGVDVVVELPTAEEMESMREEEMEAMFQVREARRREIAEREERRRQREEARRRGDAAALAEIRAQGRAADGSSIVSELQEAHVQAKERRQRAVSSVSYHDLGIARHDGTRIRASSTDSERIGLLSDAASMAPSLQSPPSMHQRERSTSSILSFDSETGIGIGVGIVGMPSPRLPRSGATTPRLSNSHTRAGSSPEIIVEADLGEIGMPTHSPPEYEEVSLDDVRSAATTPAFNEPPPNYPGPAAWERDRRLSSYSHSSSAVLVDRMSSDGDGDLSSAADNPTGSDRRGSRSSVRSSRGVGGVPQLPSLRIGNLPQIVIEPEDAAGSNNERR